MPGLFFIEALSGVGRKNSIYDFQTLQAKIKQNIPILMLRPLYS